MLTEWIADFEKRCCGRCGCRVSNHGLENDDELGAKDVGPRESLAMVTLVVRKSEAEARARRLMADIASKMKKNQVVSLDRPGITMMIKFGGKSRE